MNTQEVKRLASEESLSSLKAAEEALLNEQALPIVVNGTDEGEQLTHILSAIWVLEQMATEKWELPFAMRELTKKVRNSIS
jgi:hypothetical protein